jgi:hypothetical protein
MNLAVAGLSLKETDEDMSTNSAAHSPQNLASVAFSEPHSGQTLLSAVRHLMQNINPFGF